MQPHGHWAAYLSETPEASKKLLPTPNRKQVVNNRVLLSIREDLGTTCLGELDIETSMETPRPPSREAGPRRGSGLKKRVSLTPFTFLESADELSQETVIYISL